MVPNLSRAGTSFKGAFLYQMHDKDRATTAERVEWTSVRNLMTDRADTAERVMIATALDSDRLKEAAGIKATGRKSTAHVQTLSLAWHPNETPSREEMERAADSALKALGLEDYQTFITAHSDTAHKHLHMIINRVHPQDGRMAPLSNSKRVLDRWAHEYEKSRGQIVTDRRAKKFQRQAAAREKYSAAERMAYVQKRRAEQSNKVRREGAPNPWAALNSRQDGVRARHAEEWRGLNARQKAESREGFDQYRKRQAEARGRHADTWKADAPRRKAEWRAFFRQTRQAAQERKRMEKSPAGIVALALVAAREERAQGIKHSLARLALANLISRNRREGNFAAAVERDKAALSARQSFGRDQEFKHLSERRAQEVERQRGQFKDERDRLTARQKSERDEIRQEWADLRARTEWSKMGQSDRTHAQQKGTIMQDNTPRPEGRTDGEPFGIDWDKVRQDQRKHAQSVAEREQQKDRVRKVSKTMGQSEKARSDEASEQRKNDARAALAKMRAERDRSPEDRNQGKKDRGRDDWER